ncbi:Inosine-5'-monophosphate dehydrogenase [Patescibacteria group bacterium]|nr:IMP dehydrogenase [Candidatus Dojkabacteria bacterium]CAG1021280.1 Inosine-5'-monophosphate dehydrogenase [Patescibacteria group bacterium]
MPANPKSLAKLKADYEDLMDPIKGVRRIENALKDREENYHEYLEKWYALSKGAEYVYPSQGLLQTPFDYLDIKSESILPQEQLMETLRMRRFFLELFNHPLRITHLKEVDNSKFVAPKKIGAEAIEYATRNGMALSIGDLGSIINGSQNERISRKERYASGPFVKLGRQARTFFVGSASPDVWNSAPAIATMAASHCLSAIPRNGLTSSIERQSDLAKEVFIWLKDMADEILDGREDKKEILTMWNKNVCGTIEANPKRVLERTTSLYKAGVRSFRVYSPEPGTGPLETLKVLRKEFGNKIEIFAGQVVDVKQAKDLEAAGADGLFVGIGGGGRCITGVRSGLAIDWPELVFSLRGEINIPVIVEGGASDHIAITLLLGASGIGVSRVVSGGTIESPGGILYCVDSNGRLFKPYGGEASARTKYLDGKLLPFEIPSFVEGEVTKAEKSYIKHVRPTLTYNLHLLIEDAILALVFRGAPDITTLHNINPSPLRLISTSGDFQRNTH